MKLGRMQRSTALVCDHLAVSYLVEKRLIRNPILKFTFLIPFSWETPVTGFRDLDHPNPGFGNPNLGLGNPNPGFGCPNLGLEHPNLGL